MEKIERKKESEERKSLEREFNTKNNKEQESYFEKVARENVVLRARIGSQLYGTNTPESDTDYSGIFMPSREMLLGLQTCKQVSLGKKPDNDHPNSAEDIDETRYTLGRFFELAMTSNPTIIELFFVPPDQIEDWNASVWPKVANNYNLFISKKLFDSFFNYAVQQEKLMTTKTERYNSLIATEAYLNSIRGVGNTCLDKQTLPKLKKISVGYKTTKNVPRNYELGQPIEDIYKHTKEEMDRYGHRRHNIIKYGFECKFGSHLVRLLMEGIELATTGKITFPLKDSKYLLEIKQGKYKLEEVLTRIAILKEEFREAEVKSELQNLPRYKEINNLLIKITKEFHNIT